MDQNSEKPDLLLDAQAPVAFSTLRGAVTEHIEDLNRRFEAGLTLRQTQTTFEVHELQKTETLVCVSLTDKNEIQYSQLIKRRNETLSGTIHVRAGQDGTPALMFADFPHPNVQVSYQEASKRLLDSSF
jgi:hypothetical protein